MIVEGKYKKINLFKNVINAYRKKYNSKFNNKNKNYNNLK